MHGNSAQRPPKGPVRSQAARCSIGQRESKCAGKNFVPVDNRLSASLVNSFKAAANAVQVGKYGA
jgi:hypothetical protein